MELSIFINKQYRLYFRTEKDQIGHVVGFKLEWP